MKCMIYINLFKLKDIKKYLRFANLEGANLINANLSYANLEGAKLEGADLRFSNLKGANLEGANLSDADLRFSNLSYANLINANLSYADLRFSNLSYADLRFSNLKGANLESANLEGANLSDAKINKYEIKDYFAFDFEGLLVFKAFGNSYYKPSSTWKICENHTIEQNSNHSKNKECACGINVATLKWIYHKFYYSNCDIWVCRIKYEDLINAVMPYNFTGKIRCERLQLIRKLTKKEIEELL